MRYINIDNMGRLNYKVKAEYDSLTSKKCQCGHVITFKDYEYSICKYCGNLHFISKKAEFDYRIRRKYGRKV